MNTTDTTSTTGTAAAVRAWPVAALALPAFVAIWSGWVGLGNLTGFGEVKPLPGTPLSDWTLDTAITLPIGMEVYAAFALRVWLSGHLPERATRFAKWSAIGSLILGAAGQVAYHLMSAAGITSAPWWITTVVACLPVAVLGMGAALAHLIRDSNPTTSTDTAADAAPTSALPSPATLPDESDDGDQGPANVPAPRPAPRRTVTPAPVPRSSSTATEKATEKPSGKAGTTRAAQAAKTAATVTRLRERHPDWTVAQIAARAGVTDRTVRRHLNTTDATDTTTSAAPVADAA